MHDVEEFELTSDLDTEILLTELPFNLTMENIIEQISDPISISVDYLTSLIDKCETVKDEYADNFDIVREINRKLSSIFYLIIKEMNSNFDLGMSLDESDSDINKVSESLYKYLILGYSKNISRFIYRYMIKNKKHFISKLDKSKKKDVTTLSLKKQQYRNKDEIGLISELPMIIKYIMSLEIEPIDFLGYISKGEYYDASIIKEAIECGQITGNFLPRYFSFIINEHENVMDEILTNIKIKLIKKLKGEGGF